MRRVLTLVTFFVLTVSLPTGALHEPDDCVAHLDVADPVGDVAPVGPEVAGTDALPWMDFTGVRLHVDDGRLVHTTGLAAPIDARPGGVEVRFWLGFGILLSDGSQQNVELRLHGHYDGAELVQSDGTGGRFPVYPVTHDGTFLRFEVPIADLEDVYGPGLEFGSAFAFVDGLFPVVVIGTGVLQDRAGSQAWVPLAGCEPVVPKEPCGPGLVHGDPRGDVAVYPVFVPDVLDQHAAMDLVAERMQRSTHDVILTLTLGASPDPDASLHYRYWLGFFVERGDGLLEYMDVRIHADVDIGTLVSSNAQGNRVLGEYSVEREGTTLQVRFPFERIQGLYPEPVRIGKPEMQSDGPHDPMIEVTKYVDYAFNETPFEPVLSC